MLFRSEGKTREESTEVKTDTLSLTSAPCKFRIDGQDVRYVKNKTGEDTTDAVYNNWYSSVYVPDTLPKSIKISGNSTVKIGDTLTLTAETVPSSQSVTWTSSDEDVATVEAGVVSPVAVGTARITAEFSNDASMYATKTITVTND